MYEDYINNNLDSFRDYLEENDLTINQNQFDALEVHRHLVYRLGPQTKNIVNEIFQNHRPNDPQIKELYWNKLYNAMVQDLKNQTGKQKYSEYGEGWENRIKDELELFFDGVAFRNY